MAEPRETRVTPPKPKPPKRKPPKAPTTTTPYAPGGAAVPGYHQPAPPRNYAGSSPTGPNADLVRYSGKPRLGPPLPALPNLMRSPSPGYRAPEIDFGPSAYHPILPKIASPYQQANAFLGMRPSPGPGAPHPPPKSYLEQNPDIAAEILRAQQVMDPFDFENFMADKLEEYNTWDMNLLNTRLEAKAIKYKRYYTEAQVAQGRGDLDYTEDNPINPRLLKYPASDSQGTSTQLRAEMNERLKGLDPKSAEYQAIYKLYEGDTYNDGLLDFASPGEYLSKDAILQRHRDALAETDAYQVDSLIKSEGWQASKEAKYEADMAKYKGHEDDPGWMKPVEPVDPHEPGLDFHSNNPIDNPFLNPGDEGYRKLTPYEKKQQRKLVAQSIADGTFDKKLSEYEEKFYYDPYRGKKRPEFWYDENHKLVKTVLPDDAKEVRAGSGINVIGGDNVAPSAAEQLTAAGYQRPEYSNPTGDTTGSQFNAYVEDPAGFALMAGLDKATRPLAAVAAGVKYVYEQDEDEKAERNTLFGLAFGRDLGAGYEDMSLGDIGGLGKAMGGELWGDTDEVWWKGPVSNQEHLTSFRDVIHTSAEMEKAENIYDHHWYQEVAGLAGDIAFDPLNAVTAGTVAAGGKFFRQTAKEIAAAKEYNEGMAGVRTSVDELMESAGIAHLAEAQEAAEIIKGRIPLPRSELAKREHVHNVRAAVERVGNIAARHLMDREVTGNDVGHAVRREVEEMQARREEVLNDAGMSSVRDQLETFVHQQVEDKKLPVTALDRYDSDGMLHSMAVEKVLPDVDRHMTYWGKVAAEMHDIYESENLVVTGLNKVTVQSGRTPKLLSQSYVDKTVSHTGEESRYIQKLKQDRAVLEQQFGTGELSKAQKGQLRSIEDRIHQAEAKMAEKYGEVEKGSFANMMKEGAALREKGGSDWERFERVRKQAEARLAKAGTHNPGTDLRKLLPPELWADPRLQHGDIYDALQWSRGFAYGSKELAKHSGAIKGVEATLKKQREGMNAAEKSAKKRGVKPENDADYKTYKASYEGSMQSLKANRSILHGAQAAHFIGNLNRALKNTGQQTLRETDRSFQLNRLLQEVRHRANKAAHRVVDDAGRHVDDEALDPRYDVDTDILNRKPSRFDDSPEILSEKELNERNEKLLAKKQERKTETARLHEETPTDVYDAESVRPTEFLNEDNTWVEGALERPEGWYSDEQWFDYLDRTITKQLEEARSDYWRKVTDTVNLNDVPKDFLKDGRFDRDKLKEAIDRNPNTGVWTRVKDLGTEERNEWADQLAHLLTREYHDIRHNIARGKEARQEDIIKDQARIDFDENMKRNVQRIAPMFAKRIVRKVPVSAGSKEKKTIVTGERLTDEEALKYHIDEGGNGDQLFPYIELPEEPGRLYLLGREETNKHLRTLATPQDIMDANNALAVLRELQAGVKKTGKFRKGVEGTQMHAPGIETRLNFLRSKLEDEGWIFSGDNKQDIAYILKNEKKIWNQYGDDTMRADFGPLALPNIVANRMFKDMHGYSVHEAKQLKERSLLRTVSSISKGWTESVGENITKYEFIKKALSSKEDFWNVMAEGPFKFHATAAAKSEKESRTIWKSGRPVTLSAYGAGHGRSMAWAEENWAYLQKMSHADRIKKLEDIYDTSRRRFKKTAAGRRQQGIDEAVQQMRAQDPDFIKGTLNERKRTSEQAYNDTLDDLDQKLLSNRLTNKGYSNKIQLQRETNIADSSEDLLKFAEKRMAKDKLDEIKAAKTQAEKATREERKILDAQIKEKEAELFAIRSEYRAFREERNKVQALYEKELAAEAIIRAARMPLARNDRQMAIGLFGTMHAIPKSEHFFRQVEKASDTAIGRGMAKAWSSSFRPPSKDIHVDMATIRARQMGMTPAIIKRDVDLLAKQWDKIPPEVRKTEWKKVWHGLQLKHLQGTAVGDALHNSFSELLPYFKQQVQAGRPDEFITRHNINRFLKPEYRINFKLADKRLETVDDLIYAITHTFDDSKQLVTKGDKLLEDPFEILWNLKIATNQAAADQAMRHAISSQFGVWRGLEWVSGKLERIQNYGSHHAVVEGLDKDAGWVLVPELDNGTHYYPPETANSIKALLKMVEPEGELHKVVHAFDVITDIGKGLNTLPNPGYWTNNTIGEVMASWLDGVWSHVPYRRSAKVIKFMRSKEFEELPAMQSHTPMAAHMAGMEGQTVKDSDVLFQMTSGEKVTAERAAIAYHDQGLKTGFFSTDFAKRLGAGGKLRSNPALNKFIKGSKNVRQAGENHEDWLRMAHFLDVIAKHPGSFDDAVKEAAARTRRFHVDYSDFNHFEKTVMARVFPFYKWTRKMAPLMLSQFFVNPGKSVVVPKIMNTMGNTLSSSDFHEDPNGYMPNFTGIAPNWLTDVFAFQTSTENANGMVTAFRLPTPQIDASMRMLNPVAAAYGLLHPGLKLIQEQIWGQTLGYEDLDKPGVEGRSKAPSGFDEPVFEGGYKDESTERLKNLIGTTGAWGHFINKGIGKDVMGDDLTLLNDLKRGSFKINSDNPDNRELLNQLTGLGYYNAYPG